MSAQFWPGQRHTAATDTQNVGAGDPLQLPGSAVNVCPCTAEPLNDGNTVFCGATGAAATTADAAARSRRLPGRVRARHHHPHRRPNIAGGKLIRRVRRRGDVGTVLAGRVTLLPLIRERRRRRPRPAARIRRQRLTLHRRPAQRRQHRILRARPAPPQPPPTPHSQPTPARPSSSPSPPPAPSHQHPPATS